MPIEMWFNGKEIRIFNEDGRSGRLGKNPETGQWELQKIASQNGPSILATLDQFLQFLNEEDKNGK